MPNWKKVIVSGSNAVLNQITASGAITNNSTVTATRLTGSFTGSFVGDGNNLDLSSNTSISTTPFPFAGDAVISGSLLISSSNVGGVSTASLSLQGSGSTIFTIQGSQGNLFSVTDDLLHDNLVVNDISGDTIFKVSGSGLILIPVGDLTGSAAATASYGHFIGDGGGLTNLNTTTPTLQQVVTAGASAAGDVSITGSLTISGSFHAFTLDSDNVVLGAGAGASMEAGADNNVILGTAAGNSLTTGDNNTLIGSGSGGSLTTTSQNTFIGANSGHQNSGQYQVAIGQSDGRYGSGTSAQYNVAIGRSALQGRNSAAFPSYTVAVGASAGFYNYRGEQNTFVGYQAGYGNTSAAASGNNNVGIGPNTLYKFGDNADNNIAIGQDTGYYIVQGLNNILIGSGSYGTGDISNQLKIGNQLSPIISGSLTTGDITFANTASAPNFSGSFQGDGSQLTNLNTTTPTLAQVVTAGATAAGDVQITGSLIISQSYTAGDTDSTALRLFGSGSVSESGIFEVEGSAGPLFSVQDGLDGILMEVNNISGLPLFQVSSSNEVFVNRGNLTSGVNTATASFAMFSGSFQGNASQLTNISAGNISGNITTADTASYVLSSSIDGITNYVRVDQTSSMTVATASYVGVGASSGLVPFTTTDGKLTTESEFKYNTTTNQLTVDSLNVRHLTSSFITASTIITSGSNTFGDEAGVDVQTLIGTTIMTGSAQVTGSLDITKEVTVGSAGQYGILFKNSSQQTLDIAQPTNANNIYLRISNAEISASSPINTTQLNIDSKQTIDTYTSTIDELTLNPNADWAAIRLNRDGNPKPIIVEGSITSSYNVSSSAASTASFGAYIGNGSQLTNLPTQDPFPFSGSAEITGSLEVFGPFIPNGINKLTVNNVVIGRAAGENMSISTTAGIDNTLIGAEAGNDLTSGNNNVLIGYKAGEYLTTSQDVIAIGKAALGADGTAGNALNYVIAIGANAGGRLQGGIGDGDHHGIYIGRNAGINIDSNDGNRNNILIGHRNVGPSSQGHFGEGHLRIGQGMDSNAVIFPISASLTTGSVLIPQLKVDSVNTANSASGTTLSVEGSGSTVFEVIGSEGTLFSIDDDLDGVIFIANDRTGLPVLEASASGEVYIGKAPQSLYTTAVISSTTANISQSIFGLSTSSYGGVFVDYTANSGSNARAGSIVSVWNGSSINFTETTTLDIGDTSNLLMQVAISQSQAQVQSYATTAGYNIKTIIRSI